MIIVSCIFACFGLGFKGVLVVELFKFVAERLDSEVHMTET